MAVKLDVLINIISKNAILKMGRELNSEFKRLGKKFSFDDFFGSSKGVGAFEKSVAKTEKSMERIVKATEKLALKWMRNGTLEKMAKMFGYDIYGEEGMSEFERFKSDFAKNWFLKIEKDKAEKRSEAAKKAAKSKELFDKYRKESEEDQSKADAEWLKGKEKQEATKAKYEAQKKKSWQDIFMDTVRGQTSRNPIFDQMKKFYTQQDKNAKAEAKRIEINKREEERLRRKQWMLMLGKWGKFGVWGLVAQQAIKYVSRAVGYAYSTSMEGLDWERTIRGGAAGGSWFGQGLAGYQRAGIGKANYQNFKRGVQGYLGSVKLGMGNAAPLMYLGLSALGNPDELERQLERSLRRLPKDVSLALAGQMGLDYNMWEAIYSGRLNRDRSAYSEQAMKEWAELARGMNELLTNINVFFFNYLAPMMGAIGEFLQQLSEGKTGIGQSLDIASGYVSRVVKVALAPIEIVLKNTNGEVVQTATATPQNDTIEQTAKEYSI